MGPGDRTSAVAALQRGPTAASRRGSPPVYAPEHHPLIGRVMAIRSQPWTSMTSARPPNGRRFFHRRHRGVISPTSRYGRSPTPVASRRPCTRGSCGTSRRRAPRRASQIDARPAGARPHVCVPRLPGQPRLRLRDESSRRYAEPDGRRLTAVTDPACHLSSTSGPPGRGSAGAPSDPNGVWPASLGRASRSDERSSAPRKRSAADEKGR